MEKAITQQMLDELREALKKTMSSERYEHVIAVERMVIRLCDIYLPEKKDVLAAAALLHDFTKEYDTKVQLSILTKPGIEFSEEDRLAPKTFHARTASLLIPDLYPEYAHDEVISAVRWHTTGHEGMTLCEKLLYLADYIDESRTHEDCVKLREYFFAADPESDSMNELEKMAHLNRTLLKSFDMTIDALLHAKKVISRDTITARNGLICELNRAEV